MPLNSADCITSVASHAPTFFSLVVLIVKHRVFLDAQLTGTTFATLQGFCCTPFSGLYAMGGSSLGPGTLFNYRYLPFTARTKGNAT